MPIDETTIQLIPVEGLIDPPLVLREVNQRCVEYAELKDSLMRRGFLNSICVRPSVRFPDKFEVVDGRWRTCASREIPILKVPCIVKYGLTNKDVMAMQVIANATRPATRPSDFARQIRRLLASKEGMTQAELCQLLNKNPNWVRRMLGLAALSRYKVYRNAVDRSEMSIEAAYYLSRLPRCLWREFDTEAKLLPVREFKALVMACLRQRRAQLQAGSIEQALQNIEPQPYARSLTDLLSEIKNADVAPLTLTVLNCKTPLEGWRRALEWASHLDPESIRRQQYRIQKRLRQRTVKRAK